jgi:hypothetical protein
MKSLRIMRVLTQLNSLMYKATNNKTGEIIEMTEKQVYDEFVDTYQHDLGTAAEYGDDDAAIERDIRSNSLDDMFNEDVFDGFNYTITK